MSNARYGLRTLTLGEVRTLSRRNVLPFVSDFFSTLFGMPRSALSLRLLVSGYTGPAIRVRRSNDNAEQDIDFLSASPNAGIDTTALLNFVGANNGFVTTIYDQSTNGNNAVMSTSTQQAQIVSSGSLITRGGFPALEFSGKLPGKQYTIANLVSESNVTSFRVTEHTVSNVSMTFNNRSQFNYVAIEDSGDTSIFQNYGTGTNPIMFTNGEQFTGTTRGQVWTAQNGRKIISERGSTIGWDSGGAVFRYGGFNFNIFDWEGYLHEVIFYNSDKMSDRTDIEQNINSYYGIL
jgi:hypothetical protein